MGTRTSHRSRTFRSGLAATAAGILLAVTGLVAAPASAGQGQGSGYGEITICHRTNAPDNPYTLNRVSFRSTDGSLVGNDHLGHGGPAFDYTADPEDDDYPYTTPRDGDQWGDIIPPYEWEGGSYPGSEAWQGSGAAILAAGCTGSTDVDVVDLCEDGSEAGEDGTCDETVVDACPDVDGFQAEGPCGSDPVDACPELDGFQAEGPCGPPQDVCEDLPGIQAEGPCDPEPVDACPDVDGFQQSTDQCVAVLIPPVMIENLPPSAEAPEVAPIEVPAARRPTTVAGIQVLPATAAAQELPRTGVDTATLVQLGLGLVMVGAGVMVAARRPQGAPER
ncbi:MAG: LPXTG cell wall anchor domain-containing protein [Acidimicrobiia bacterium]